MSLGGVEIQMHWVNYSARQCCLNSSVQGWVSHSSWSFRPVAVSKLTLVFTYSHWSEIQTQVRNSSSNWGIQNACQTWCHCSTFWLVLMFLQDAQHWLVQNNHPTIPWMSGLCVRSCSLIREMTITSFRDIVIKIVEFLVGNLFGFFLRDCDLAFCNCWLLFQHSCFS